MISKWAPMLMDHYRYVWGHPVGRWMIWVVLVGLGFLTFMSAIYLPIVMERRDFLRDAGATWVD